MPRVTVKLKTRVEKPTTQRKRLHCRRNCDLSSCTEGFCSGSSALSRGCLALTVNNDPIVIASLEHGGWSTEPLREEYGDDGPGGGEGV